MTNIADKICIENQNTHFVFNFLFFLENRAVYAIMWKNIVDRTGHRWQYGACTFHAGYLKLETHTENM